MNKPLFTICIVNYNSSQFVGLVFYALKKLTFNSYKIIVRDNNSNISDYNNLIKIINDCDYREVELYRVETNLTGSEAHGEALNDLSQRINTKYGVIMDADAVFLVKGWDNVLMNSLNERQPIIGTQADISSGKPEDFPLMFAMMFDTLIFKKMNIDFRPKDINRFQDTGWQMRDKYLSFGLSGGLIYSFNTRKYKKGPFKNVICSEYYLDRLGEGQIFASHFGRGSAPKAKKLIKVRMTNNLISKIINRFLLYANVIKWKVDRKRWINISTDLINKQ